jgi:hypothetical protein
MLLSMIGLLLGDSHSFLILRINPLLFTDTVFFGQSRLLLLVGKLSLFSFDALLFCDFLLPLLFLFLQFFRFFFGMVVSARRTTTRTGASSLLLFLLLVLLLLFCHNLCYYCRFDYDHLFTDHYARQWLILRRSELLIRSVCSNCHSCAAITEVHVSFECLIYNKLNVLLTTWRLAVYPCVC